jgi:phosphate starvation-inducible PhoH-like protein
VDAIRVLDGVEGIEFCFLKDSDVVRHALVRRIIVAYERYAKENPEQEGEE